MEKQTELQIKIKLLRKKLNMSQDRFGLKIGVSGKSISAYETGKCIPPLKIIEKISEEYDTAFISMKSNRRNDLKDKINTLKQLLLDIETVVLK